MPSVSEIAAALAVDWVGDGELRLDGAAHPAEAGPSDLAMAMDPKYAAQIADGAAKAAVLTPGVDWRALGLEAALFAPRARVAMAGVTRFFAVADHLPLGVHPTALIDPSAEIGAEARIGAFCIVDAGARIGDGAILHPHSHIGARAALGAQCLVHSGVRIGRDVRIGARVILHPNACIGVDGFSFVTPEKGSVESAKETGEATVSEENAHWLRIHSLATVEIGDDVEIGSCATIDRGTVANTRIGAGTKIDNLVQIGHNVRIGENCMLCGQSGVAGSAVVGDRVVLGGQVGVADHSRIGDDVLVMASSGVSGNVRSRSIVGGTPALPRDVITEIIGHMRRLPRYARDLEQLKKIFSDRERSG